LRNSLLTYSIYDLDGIVICPARQSPLVQQIAGMTVEGLTGGYWPSQDAVPCLKMQREIGLHGPEKLSALTASKLEGRHELKRLIRDHNLQHDLYIVAASYGSFGLLHQPHFEALHNQPSDPISALALNGNISGSSTLHFCDAERCAFWDQASSRQPAYGKGWVHFCLS
jgi:hypothetical protein